MCHDAGGLQLLGRLDHQVKMAGVRLDLAEVEAVLVRHPAVLEAAVVRAPVRYQPTTDTTEQPGAMDPQPHLPSHPAPPQAVAYTVLHHHARFSGSTEPQQEQQQHDLQGTEQPGAGYRHNLSASSSAGAGPHVPTGSLSPSLEQQLRSWLLDHLPARGLALQFVSVPHLPRNPAGKLLRKELPPPPPSPSLPPYMPPAPAQGPDGLSAPAWDEGHAGGEVVGRAREVHGAGLGEGKWVLQAAQGEDMQAALQPSADVVSRQRQHDKEQQKTRLQPQEEQQQQQGQLHPQPDACSEVAVMRAVVAATGLPPRLLEATTDIFAAGATSLAAAEIAGQVRPSAVRCGFRCGQAESGAAGMAMEVRPGSCALLCVLRDKGRVGQRRTRRRCGWWALQCGKVCHGNHR